MLKPDEILGLDKGFDAVFTTVSPERASAVWGLAITSTFFSSILEGSFISCFSWRKGANIINFFF